MCPSVPTLFLFLCLLFEIVCVQLFAILKLLGGVNVWNTIMDSNLLNNLFNIKESDIEKFDSYNNEDGSIIVHIRLKKKEDVYCPICNKKLSCNGYKVKPIKHKALSDRNMKIFYEADNVNIFFTKMGRLIFTNLGASYLTHLIHL